MSDKVFNRIMLGCWGMMGAAAIFAYYSFEVLANIFMIAPAVVALVTTIISRSMHAANRNESRED